MYRRANICSLKINRKREKKSIQLAVNMQYVTQYPKLINRPFRFKHPNSKPKTYAKSYALSTVIVFLFFVTSLSCKGTRFRFVPGASMRVRGFRHTGHVPRGPFPEESARCSSLNFRVSMMHLWQKRCPENSKHEFILISEDISHTAYRAGCVDGSVHTHGTFICS